MVCKYWEEEPNGRTDDDEIKLPELLHPRMHENQVGPSRKAFMVYIRHRAFRHVMREVFHLLVFHMLESHISGTPSDTLTEVPPREVDYHR